MWLWHSYCKIAQIQIYEGSSTLRIHYRHCRRYYYYHRWVPITHIPIIFVIIHIGQRRCCVFFSLPFLSLLLVLSDRSATVVAFCRCAFSSLSVCRRNIHTRYFLISFRLPRLHRWATYLSHAHTKWHF